MALAWLKRVRIEDGRRDARSGMRLRRGLSAGRQATIMAMLTSRATLGALLDRFLYQLGGEELIEALVSWMRMKA